MNPVGIPTQNFISTDTFVIKENAFSDLSYIPAPYQSGTGLPLWICGHKEGKRVDPVLLLCRPENVELIKSGFMAG